MQNVLNIACHIQCPINLNFFDAPAWARRLEIQRIIMYLRGPQNTQRPLSCLNLSSLGPDWPFVLRSFFGGAETTMFPNTESQAWGVPYIWTSCSGDSYRPGNLGGSFESYKLNATEKSLREHQIQSPSSFLTLRPGVAQ